MILYAYQEKDKLRIKNLSGKYNKLFSWLYEGPVNGIGTFCEPCTANEKESKDFIDKSICVLKSKIFVIRKFYDFKTDKIII